MVAVTGVVPAFIAIKTGILPVPLAAKPMLGVLFVQLYVVPETGEPPKITAAEFAPLHIAGKKGGVTEGVGLTVIVNVFDIPVQPSKVGVTVMVAEIGLNPN